MSRTGITCTPGKDPGQLLRYAGRWGLVIFLGLAGLASPAWGIRLKDIAVFKGVRPNQLIGNGLVVGLNGTGDGTNVDFNTQELANFLTHLGINVSRDKLKVKNVAAVAVTAMLPPFARVGSRIDVLVSSLGDAKSLQGGTLLLTPLKGADGQVYALAQGPVSVGGFTAGGAAGGGVTKNHPTAGRIAAGAAPGRISALPSLGATFSLPAAAGFP